MPKPTLSSFGLLFLNLSYKEINNLFTFERSELGNKYIYLWLRIIQRNCNFAICIAHEEFVRLISLNTVCIWIFVTRGFAFVLVSTGL